MTTLGELLCGLRAAVFHGDAAAIDDYRNDPRIRRVDFVETYDSAMLLKQRGVQCGCPRCFDATAHFRALDTPLMAELRQMKRIDQDRKARSMLDRGTFERIWLEENPLMDPDDQPTDEPWEIDAILD